MDGSRQQQQQQQIQQILQQALASSNVPASQHQLSPVNSSVLAQLAPLSTSASRVICASPLPLQFPISTCSSAVTSLAPPVGRIIYTQPATLAGAGGFAVLSPCGGGFTAVQVIGAGHQLGSAGGMVVVPSSVAPTYHPHQLRGPAVTNTPVLAPFLIRHGGVSSMSPVNEAGSQFVVRSAAVSPSSSRTPGSATVHHLGTSDTKESPFIHLRGHLQSAKSQDSSALKLSSGVDTGRRQSTESLESEKPLSKRIKLEVQDDDMSDKVFHKLYIDSHEGDLAEIRASYHDHMTELFFLENGGNLMDYLVWSKRPNVHLNRMLQAESLDADVDRVSGEEEKRINNEVKVLTTFGSTIPIITPVAIATTLPAAITALQQQELASGLPLLRKAGGRHGMVFGYVPPKTSQLLPLVPGGMPISPKAATTTVGSPPPYVISCSATLPIAANVEPMSTTMTVSSYGTQSDNVSGILSRPALCDSPSVSASSDRLVCMMPLTICSATMSTNLSSISPTIVSTDLGASCTSDQLLLSVSNEAIVDQAKQEAQVLQRISDLRRQGMWSARRLPKVQEAVRCKSQWDYLLDEMQWLAVDFAQERRWKMAAAKKLSNEVMKYHAILEERRKERDIKTAGLIAGMVREFWANIIETAYCQRQLKLEEKRNSLFEYIAKGLIENEIAKDVDMNINGHDHCYSSVGEACNDENNYQNEIDDLIREGEMPLQELVDKYSGAYDVDFVLPPSPESVVSDESDSSNDSEMSEPQFIGTVCQAVEMCSEDTSVAVKNIEELISVAQAARPPGINLIDCQKKLAAPQYLKVPLREYQLIGIDWMTAVCRHGMGCVLADATGVGKKVQTIGFLAHLASECGSWGLHLVVTPTCYMLTWEVEFEKCFPACRTFAYYGEAGRRRKLRKDFRQESLDHHVFITSYNILLEDFEYFKNTKWQCLILDDIDNNEDSGTLTSLLSLSTTRNILLTNSDTTRPSQSHLTALSQFLTTKTCRADESMQLERCRPCDLEKLVSLLSLRRTEYELREQLPKIHESEVICSLSCKQQRIYEDLIAKHSKALVGRHVKNILQLILSIQKLTNHPDLIQPCQISFSFCMDPLEYKTSARVVNAVVHDIWKRAERGLLKQQLLADAAAENAVQDQDTDLFVELELIMSATKPMEACIEASSEIHADRLCTVLKADNLLQAVFPNDICTKLPRMTFGYSSSKEDTVCSARWKSCGYSFFRASIMDLAYDMNSPTDGLLNLFHIQSDYAKDLGSRLKRLFCVVPAVSASAINMTTDSSETRCESVLTRFEAACRSSGQIYLENVCMAGAGVIFLNQPTAACSGKLVELDRLLALLSMQSCRVIVLTKMTRMLDMLEAYMDSKHRNHLRLDSSVEAEEQRRIVQQFNADKRIGCLLMLSRMPVLGLDLPEADAVIFYDFDLRSDTRDHAEVFCRRLALKRDLEIFRLKTTGTIEETISCIHQGSILCGSSPDTAEFSQVTIDKLFKSTSHGDEMVQCDEQPVDADVLQFQKTVLTMALDRIEEFDDVRAAKLAKNEKKLSAEDSACRSHQRHVSRLRKRRQSLSCSFEIENYAVDYIEHQMEPPFDISEMACELESKPTKNLWMASVSDKSKVVRQLQEEEEDEVPLTYNFEPAQLFVDDTSGELMPVWAPPTPPQDDSDVYIDQTQSFVYDPTPMSESQLPPVYVRKGHKRHRVDPLARKQKIRARDDLPSVPRSLFDCPQTIAQRMERDARLLKQQGMLKPGLKIQLQQQQQVMTQGNSGAMMGRPMTEQTTQHETAEWLIYEDWALLQALQTLQEMPLNLLTSSPGHLPNWDLVADVVNGVSRTYRSPKQCKQRYENFILPREEGRVTYDASPRKLKKATKGIYKTKYNRSMRTQQLYVQDNTKASTTLYTLRFDAIKMIAAARTPAARPQPTGAVAAGLKNTKHIAVLAENGINYDQPLSPGHVATMRAERIAKEVKEKKMASTAGNLVQVDVQQTAQPSQQQQQIALQRPSVAVPSSTLQQLIIQSTQAATGHVILQPGQQLISTATGQHVLASVDGRTQQMTIVQGTAGSQAGQATVTGTIPAASLLSAGLVKSSGASIGATGTNVVTAVSLARSINMTGIIVSQAIAGQTIATINKGQTVVAPFLQAQNAAHVRGALRAPFALKDATSVSIVSQSTGGVLSEAAIARVISTTTPLTPAQLVVTQQKPGIVGVSTVPQGTLQQQLLGLSGAPTAGTLAAAAASKGLTTMQPVHVMRQKQVLQQLRPTMSVQQISQQMNPVSGSMATIVASGQKTVTVTTPVVSGISPAIPLKSMQNPAAFQEMLKRTQQQQQVAKAVQGTGTVAIQQIQVTKAQLLDGMQIQQVPSCVSAQTVATLMRAVSSTATGAVVSSVTLPNASGVSSAINFFPQQKLLAGKLQAQPIRQLQMQKRPAATVQIQNPQKTTAIQQMTKIQSGGSPVIFRPQQVVVQQMPTQQFAKSTQQGVQAPRIQQFISSGQSSASAALLATQIIGQPGSGSTVSVAAPPTVAKTLSVTITTSSLPSAVSTIAMSSPAGIAGATLQNTGVPMTATVKLLPTSVTTLVKQIKDSSSTSTLAMTSRTPGGSQTIVQQVLIRPGPAVAMSVPSASVTTSQLTLARAGIVGVSSAPNLPVISTPVSTSSTANVVPLSPGVQQAVQEVVQQAQAQARQPMTAAINFVAVTSSGALQQSPGQTLSSPGVTIIGSNQAGNMQQQQGAGDNSTGSNKSSPYVMRLRNQKS